MTTDTRISVTASNPRPSTYTEGGVDVDVIVTIDGHHYEGEVTLLPREYDGVLDSWGSPDHWISGKLLKGIRAEDDSEPGTAQDVYSDLATVAREACESRRH